MIDSLIDNNHACHTSLQLATSNSAWLGCKNLALAIARPCVRFAFPYQCTRQNCPHHGCAQGRKEFPSTRQMYSSQFPFLRFDVRAFVPYYMDGLCPELLAYPSQLSGSTPSSECVCSIWSPFQPIEPTSTLVKKKKIDRKKKLIGLYPYSRVRWQPA